MATNGEKNDPSKVGPPRLPYHSQIQERFGVDLGGWRVLVEAIYPSAKTVQSVLLALAYCKHRNLDPFKRPVHIVPMYSRQKGGHIETVWPGIAELRTTAARTREYAGLDATEWGPTTERSFTGKVQVDKNQYENRTVKVRFPEWARITVYRIISGHRCAFVGPKVLWLESYATMGRSDLPNQMWEERPEGQLEKCAEAAALRRAFPEEIGNELTAEEMAGRTIEGGLPAVEDEGPPSPARAIPAPTVPKPKPAEAAPQTDPMELVEAGRYEPGEVVWDDDGPPVPGAVEIISGPDTEERLLAEIETLKTKGVAEVVPFALHLEARLANLDEAAAARVRKVFSGFRPGQ